MILQTVETLGEIGEEIEIFRLTIKIMNNFYPKIGSIMKVKTKDEYLEIVTPSFMKEISVLEKTNLDKENVSFLKRLVLEGLEIISGLPGYKNPNGPFDVIEHLIPFKTNSLLLLDIDTNSDLDLGLVLYEEKQLWVFLRSLSTTNRAI